MLQVNKPETVYVKFIGNLPRKFELFTENGELYFERYLDGKTPRIKFNIPDEGIYKTASNIEIIKKVDLEMPTLSFSLPPYSRNRIKDFTIIDNPKLHNTPARIFTNEGVIEKGSQFYKYTRPTRKFFLLHEVGHFFYGLNDKDIEQAKEIAKTQGNEVAKQWIKDKSAEYECYCDLFALTHFLQMGYNMSTAMYCLTNVLRRNKQNTERVLFIYKKMFKK